MSADRLLALYDSVSDAPDAVARLRSFVLDLAVRGKLVEQDPTDGLASDLLKRIAGEKTRMVKAGEIKKPRTLSTGDVAGGPFQIPAMWCWCRLDSIGAIIGGGTPPASVGDNFARAGEGIPWLTPADLGGNSGLYIERGSRDLSEKGLRTSSATLMPSGTVLFSSRAPIGYVSIAANPISTNQGFKSIVPYVRECSRFIAIAMQAFAPEIDASASGTTFREVSGKLVAGLSFPLPPLSEQRRIVAKVDEFMALCDRLAAACASREETRNRLTMASFARLSAPDTDPATFRSNARFAVNALPALTDRADQVRHFRQTVLDLAVRGKLVEQDPADEPVSELLQRIAAERKKIAVSDRRRRVPIPKPLDDHDFPHILPPTWVWAALDDITISRDGERVPVSKAEREQRAKVYNYYGASGIIDKIDGYLFDKPLLLIGEDGANLVNRSSPIAFIARGRYWVNNHAHVLDGLNEEYLRYLELFINATDLTPFITAPRSQR